MLRNIKNQRHFPMQNYCSDKVTRILDEFPIVTNKARKRFIVLFILAMIKTRSVQFCEIAQELNDNVKASSNEVRIQDFFREVQLNYEQVALLLCMFLPRRGKLTLCIDRTEWDFGKCQVNILMIVVKCKHITIPLYWELLDNKSGNSNTDDRISLLKKCIALLGAQRIGLFLGDREFIGHRWLKFLKEKGIKFCVRVPKHHKIKRNIGHETRSDTIEELLEDRIIVKIKNCMVDGVWGNAHLQKLKDDYLFVFGTAKTKFLAQLYRKRWEIEVFFQNVKERGFNLEGTHLQCLKKIKKLMAMVAFAYTFCVDMGLHQHKRVKPIPLKNHGYKAKSFSRKGIDIIREGLRRDWKKNIEKFYQLVDKFLRWIKINPNRFALP